MSSSDERGLVQFSFFLIGRIKSLRDERNQD